MTKEQFATQLADQLHQYFPPEDYTIRTDVFTKNNNTRRHGIIIQHKDSGLAPAIYVDDFYEDYLRKKITIQEIAESFCRIMDDLARQTDRYHGFSLEWQKCRDKITYRVISRERNDTLLNQIPYVPFLNLAIVFYLVFDISERGLESICVTEQLREKWGVSIQKLFQEAEINTPRMFAPQIDTIEHALCRFLGKGITLPESQDVPPIYIFTNELGVNGAAVLLYKDLIRDFAEEKQSDLYILPSSIHEILVIPDSGDANLLELSELVKNINRDHVLKEEVLADCAYYYDRQEKRFIF